MAVYTMRQLGVAVILTLFLGVFIVSATKWAIDMSFPKAKTITAQQFVPEFGNLRLSATLVAENEVMLNVTFSGRSYVSQPGYVWTLWVSNSIVGRETSLPEGLKLVDGALKANGTCPLPTNFIGFQVKLRAIVDGEWVVYGRFSAERGPGWYISASTDGIKIAVSNGNVAQLEKAPYPSNPVTQQPNNPQNDQPTKPPRRP